MPTANERRALWFLAIVALSGSIVRLVRARAPTAPDAVDGQLARQLSRVDSARDRRREPNTRASGRNPKRAASRNAAPGALHPDSVVDLDRATATQLEALPGIGPALAARIIAYRDSAGPFGSLTALCRVRGVGPAMVARLRPLVGFSGLAADQGGCEAAPSRASKTQVTNRSKPR